MFDQQDLSNLIKLIDSDEYPGYLLWQVSNFWQRNLSLALKESGLTPVQFLMLAKLKQLATNQQDITQCKLAKSCDSNIMTISDVTRSLEAKKLIKREVHPTDTRANCLIVTDAGNAILKSLIESLLKSEAQFFDVLGQGKKTLTSNLSKLINQSIKYKKSMSIKLYGGRMGSSLRPLWLLNEIALEHEFIQINLSQKEHKTEEYLKLNPAGQIPVMADGDFVLTESLAINSYLAEKYKPELLGSTLEEKAQANQISLWVMLNLQKHLGEILTQKWTNTNDEQIIEKAKIGLEKDLAIFDNRLDGKEYLLTSGFSIADINCATTISYTGFIQFDYSKYQNIVNWYNLVTKRPSFKQARGEM